MPTPRQIVMRAKTTGADLLGVVNLIKDRTGVNLSEIAERGLLDTDLAQIAAGAQQSRAQQPAAPVGAQQPPAQPAQATAPAQPNPALELPQEVAPTTAPPSAPVTPGSTLIMNPVTLAKKAAGAVIGVQRAIDPKGTQGRAPYEAIGESRAAVKQDIAKRAQALRDFSGVRDLPDVVYTGMANALTDIGDVVAGLPLLLATFMIQEAGAESQFEAGAKFGEAVGGGVIGGTAGQFEDAFRNLGESFYARPASTLLTALPPGRALAGAARAVPGAATVAKAADTLSTGLSPFLHSEKLAALNRAFLDGVAKAEPLHTALAEELLIDPQRASGAVRLLGEAMQKQTAKGLVTASEIEQPPPAMSPHKAAGQPPELFSPTPPKPPTPPKFLPPEPRTTMGEPTDILQQPVPDPPPMESFEGRRLRLAQEKFDFTEDLPEEEARPYNEIVGERPGGIAQNPRYVPLTIEELEAFGDIYGRPYEVWLREMEEAGITREFRTGEPVPGFDPKASTESIPSPSPKPSRQVQAREAKEAKTKQAREEREADRGPKATTLIIERHGKGASQSQSEPYPIQARAAPVLSEAGRMLADQVDAIAQRAQSAAPELTTAGFRPSVVSENIARAYDIEAPQILRSPTMRREAARFLAREIAATGVDAKRAAHLGAEAVKLLGDAAGSVRSVKIPDGATLGIDAIVNGAIAKMKGDPSKILRSVQAEAARGVIDDVSHTIAKNAVDSGLAAEVERFLTPETRKIAASTKAPPPLKEVGAEMAKQLAKVGAGDRPIAIPGWSDPRELAAAIRRADPSPAGVALGDYIERFRKLKINVSGPDFAGFIKPEVASTIEWHFRAQDELRNDTAVNRIISGIKANHTARNAGVILTNVMTNIGMQITTRGLAGPEYIVSLARVVNDYTAWRSGGKIDSRRARQMRLAQRNGIFTSNALDADIGLVGKRGWGDPGAYVPGSRTLERAFKWGDQAPKLEEFIHSWDVWERRINALGEGKFLRMPITPRKTVDVQGLPGGRVRVSGARARGGARELPRASSAMDELLARAASMRPLALMFAYDDTSLATKIIRSMGVLGLGSTFYTWTIKAIDLPFVKKGLVSHVVDDPYAFVTNDPKLLVANVARSMGLAARRTLVLNGLRAEILKEDNERLRKAFAWASNDDKLMMIKVLSDGRYASVSDVSRDNWSAPSAKMLRLFTYGGVRAAQTLGALGTADDIVDMPEFPEGSAAARKQDRLRALIMQTDAGELASASDAVELLGLAGGPVKDAIDHLLDTERAGSIVTPEYAAKTLLYMLAGGTVARLADVATGAVVEGAPKTGAARVAGRLTTRTRALAPPGVTVAAIEEQPLLIQPFADWAFQTIVGRGVRTVDILKKGDPTTPYSHLAGLRKELFSELRVTKRDFDGHKAAYARAEAADDKAEMDRTDAEWQKALDRKVMINNWIMSEWNAYMELAEKFGDLATKRDPK